MKSPQPIMEKLQTAEEVGPKVAHSIYSFFKESKNKGLVERLREEGLQFRHEVIRKQSGPLEGVTFVLTGTLPTMDQGRSQEPDRSRQRQGHRIGEQENQLCCSWRGSRIEIGKG